MFVWVSLLVLAVGCATTKKVDWNERVGTYTFDQAVIELGPPDKQAQTSDGKTVAEWITRRSTGSSVSFGTGFSSGHSAVGIGHTVVGGYREQLIRLTFGADGKLISWSFSR